MLPRKIKRKVKVTNWLCTGKRKQWNFLLLKTMRLNHFRKSIFMLKPHFYINSYSRGWCPKFAPGLNIIIDIVQKVFEWSSCPFAKKIPHWRIILAKRQFDHWYTFWTMPILIFSPGANFGHHPLKITYVWFQLP